MVRGRDAVVQNHRLFSDHPLRIPGDAVVGGFTELRLISVSLRFEALPPNSILIFGIEVRSCRSSLSGSRGSIVKS
jgi:hypothetical protein